MAFFHVEVNELARLKPAQSQSRNSWRAGDYEVKVVGHGADALDEANAEVLKEAINGLLEPHQQFTTERTSQTTKRYPSLDALNSRIETENIVSRLKEQQKNAASPQKIAGNVALLETLILDRAARESEYALTKKFPQDPGLAKATATWLKEFLEKLGHRVELHGVGRPGD
ncbi:hypothetical protein HY572_05235 [Candidatus Micrarchaeota archaeon]|nr:hypothetical protein [Candidatus Micrarchaeota archaeon]